jgi:hypothetical protein
MNSTATAQSRKSRGRVFKLTGVFAIFYHEGHEQHEGGQKVTSGFSGAPLSPAMTRLESPSNSLFALFVSFVVNLSPPNDRFPRSGALC